MPSVLAYHRPTSLAEASDLLSNSSSRLIGGGTVVVPDVRRPRAVGVDVIDLQALGLDGVSSDGGRVVVGAMVRLGQLVDDHRLPDLIRDLARRELPSALRNQATVGGTVALGDAESVLVAGLLVHDARVHVHGAEPAPLAAVLSEGVEGRIVTEVSIESGGRGAIAVAARTPADVPIVAAVARSHNGAVRVALTGVADHPVEVDPADPVAALSPPADFRGSTEYRRHLVATLTARAVAEVSS